MYKTVSINDKAYRQLNAISARLKKPKAQIIELLVDRAEVSLKKSGLRDLDAFNREMRTLFDSEVLSKKISVDVKELEESTAWIDSVDLKSY
jgi:hypothetical protein